MVGDDVTGLDKHVLFVDARDLENSSDLPKRGEAALKEHKPIKSFQAEILAKGPFEYEKDWFLGDIVTVQNKDWDITMNSRITEVTEVYEAGGLSLTVTFGISLPTLGEKLRKALKDHAQ